MERSPDLLASILHHCVISTAAWELNMSANELFNNLPPERLDVWPAYLIDGHIRLLADAGYIEMKDSDEAVVVRVTWDGYEYFDRVRNREILKNNPFLQHG